MGKLSKHTQQSEACASTPESCPFDYSGSEKKVNQPIQAKKFVPMQVKPTVLQDQSEKMDEFCYTEIVDCPVIETTLDRLGKWFGPLNLVPLYNALKTLMDSIHEFRKKAAEFPDDTCIRCNMGRDWVLLLGNTPVHWLLSQPLENVDRDSPKWGFGSFTLGDYYHGKCIPGLLASERDGHSKSKKLIMNIMKNRFQELDSAVEKTFTHRLNTLIDGYAKDPKSTNHMSAITFLTGYFVTIWLLDQEPPCNEVMVEYGFKSLSKAGTDNWIGGFLGQLLCDVLCTLDGSYRRQDAAVHMTRTSRYYKQYENMAKELGVEMQDFDKALTWTLCLPCSQGLSLPLMSCLASLGENLGTLSELRAEIGMDVLTIESLSDANKYPLLDAFCWEVKRAFLRGQLCTRRAKKDLLVPGGNGKAYRIKKNDLMCAYHPTANRDPRIYDDPSRFNPRRFYDNPELKKHVFPFGIPHEFDPTQVEWGCPIYSMGFGNQLFKLFVGKWIQRVDWSLSEVPQFTGDAIGEYRPYYIPYAKLQYREAYLKWLKQNLSQ